MHLINPEDPMERDTTQRKTVYRISLTLVKKESADDTTTTTTTSPTLTTTTTLTTPNNNNNIIVVSPKAGRGGDSSSATTTTTAERQQWGGGLLEQLCEVVEEREDGDGEGDEGGEEEGEAFDDFRSPSRHRMRNFRTFSTGQLELGRLKLSRKQLFAKREPKETPQGGEGGGGAASDGSGLGSLDVLAAIAANGNGKDVPKGRERLTKTRSTDEGGTPEVASPGSPPPPAAAASDGGDPGNGVEAGAPEGKRPPGLLRRSFSFRHWTGVELLRLRALAKEKHHGSSGCIGRQAPPSNGPQCDRDDDSAFFAAAASSPTSVSPSSVSPSSVSSSSPSPSPLSRVAPPPPHTLEKSRTLEMGAVLSKTASATELGRRERARVGKNRTLDNSDLQRMAEHGGRGEESGSGAFYRGRASGHERRLVRFFSGFFSRRDSGGGGGGGGGGGSPLGSPGGGVGRSLRRTRRAFLSQSSTESMSAAAHSD
ncbi:hypothetical protein NHX12_015070, partial [Muraenolepis orangiensis]